MKRSRWSRPSAQQQPAGGGEPRKPRILVAGEFSAGKTRLINGLAEAPVLPSNVTATALPPIWLVGEARGLARVDHAGRLEGLSGLGEINIDRTSYCFMGHSASILEDLDIIDTPGNSDPNMAAVTWQRMLDYADAVVWCTNGTQAWRQSEKAVWQAMPQRLRNNAMLIITHADLMPDQANAGRVLQRVEREAAAYFDTFLMASLLDPEDLDGIRDHIRHIASRLEPLTGAHNTLMADFLAGKAAVAGQAPARPEAERQSSAARAMQIIRPRRVKRAVEEEPIDDFKVVQLARAAARANETGMARAQWEGLSRGLDTSDPEAILAAVERLITLIDSGPKETPGGVDGYSGKARGGRAVGADGSE
ncbi:hypothetical protein [Mesobacterium pallidum]|uniref:hypothetical protein n=1 Tax=Mesobacterium pallidum TaxID=2872037 RepID=UPI001EE1FDBB|nr:hypothetical protein [Mesobacterium pallidum]